MFSDVLTLDAPKRTSDGYMAVRARAARTGVYDYLATEPSIADALPEGHNFKPTDIVKVLRDENTVFDQKSAHSFIGKPVTDDHPSQAVNSFNWRDHARGVVMGAIREGEYLSFDLLLTDATTIAKVDAGKAELSNGYGAVLEFGDFTAPDGTKCHARQASIAGNHVAIVDRGRAGSACRIGDAARCEPAPQSFLDSLIKEKPVKTMLIDGLTVDISNADTAIATVQTLIAARDAAQARLADKDRELATKDTEIADLKSKVSDEATLDARADAKAALVSRGKELLGDAMPDVKGKSLADTRRAIVLAVTKDASLADKSDDYIEARFDGLKDAKPADPVRDALIGGLTLVGDNGADVRNLARAAQY